MGKLIASVDPLLEDYIEAAAQAEHVALDEYAGALLQVGWEALFGIRRSDRLKRAAAASRQAELRANFVRARAGLVHKPPDRADSSRLAAAPQSVEGDHPVVARHHQLDLGVSGEEATG